MLYSWYVFIEAKNIDRSGRFLHENVLRPPKWDFGAIDAQVIEVYLKSNL